MSEEQKDNPKFEFKNIGLGKSMELTLDCAKAVKTGEGNFGTWNMWFGLVEDAKVTHGRKPNLKVEEGYTGKVILFPAKKLNENLEKAAAGNVGVRVKITKEAEEGQRGLITNYRVEKLSEGKPSESSSQLTPTEMNLLNESQEIRTEGYEITEDIFIKSSQEPQYKGNITAERAKELFVVFTQM